METVSFKPAARYAKIAEKVFHEQKIRINHILPYANIQHVGSTAIPGSLKKGDVDIVVRVPADKFQLATQVMRMLYEINQPGNWTKTFASFKSSNIHGLEFGAQLVVQGSATDDFVQLSKALASDSRLLNEYNRMKMKYEGKSMESYRKEKAKFFQKLRKKLGSPALKSKQTN